MKHEQAVLRRELDAERTSLFNNGCEAERLAINQRTVAVKDHGVDGHGRQLQSQVVSGRSVNSASARDVESEAFRVAAFRDRDPSDNVRDVLELYEAVHRNPGHAASDVFRRHLPLGGPATSRRTCRARRRDCPNDTWTGRRHLSAT